MVRTASGAVAAASIWEIDAAHTSVEFSAKHMMITSVKGRFRDVRGVLVLDEADPALSSVEVEIGAASVDTGAAIRDEHLRSADFLEVARYPVLRFESRTVDGTFQRAGDRFKVVGDLTIHGVTREVVLDVVYEGRVVDSASGERLGFNASTTIDRRDFGLTFNQALETGGVLVGNTIRIAVEVQTVRI